MLGLLSGVVTDTQGAARSKSRREEGSLAWQVWAHQASAGNLLLLQLRDRASEGQQESTHQRGSHCPEARDRGGNGRYREIEGEGSRPSPNTCIRLRDSLNHSEGTGPGLILSLHALAWCSCRLPHRTTVPKAGKQLRLDHTSPNDIIQWPPSRWQWDLGRVHLDAGA